MKRALCASVLVVVLGLSSVTFAASKKTSASTEKKERTTASKKQEQQVKKPVISSGQIKEVIKRHIDIVSVVNKGSYPIYDNDASIQLQLKFVKFHDERVNRFKKEDAYIICTVFHADDNTKYDIDLWVKANDKGELEVYMNKIHKKDGKPRYTYRDDEIGEVK